MFALPSVKLTRLFYSSFEALTLKWKCYFGRAPVVATLNCVVDTCFEASAASTWTAQLFVRQQLNQHNFQAGILFKYI